MSSKTNIKKITLCGLFTAIIAVCAQISIPTPIGVAVTLQTFAAALSAFVLGPLYGTAAVFCYAALGAAGVPVFANFSGGIAVITGPSGGFIAGFLPLAVLCGFAARRKSVSARAALSAAGLIACYAVGIIWYLFATGAAAAAALPYVPYFIKDVVMLFAAYFLSKKLSFRREFL